MVIGSSTGPIIRATKLWIALLFCLTMPTTVFAESRVQGSIINNPAKIEHSTNIAAGSNNKASQFSIALKNTRMRGKLINSSSGNGKTNIAIGSGNNADQESIRIENSRVRGTVINRSTMQKSGNMAAGSGNSASQATIVMGGVQLRGTVINDAAGKNAINSAVGYRNEANQSSIVIDGNQPATMAHDDLQADSGSSVLRNGNLLPMTKIKSKGKPGTLAYVNSQRVRNSKKQKTAQHVPGQVLFLIDNNKTGLANLDRVAGKYHLKIGDKTVLKSLNRIMVVSSVAGDAEEIAEALSNDPGIYSPQPNFVFATMDRQDPLSPMQNLVSMLDLKEVHRKVSGKNITVAVIDTGVEIEHQDLRSRIIGHQNFIPDSTYRGEIHGTAVAGIIGADINEYGIVGIAPDVSLLALRACRQLNKESPIGECFSTSLARSLDAAITAKVDLVNLSLGAQVNDVLLSMMIDNGSAKGIVFTAPVGNDPTAENIAFPASHKKVISVAGLDEQGNPLPNKQLASMADAVAPATHLFVTTPGNSYNFIDGTSLASGSIAGIIALTMEKKNKQNSRSCLPHFNSAVPWPKQVLSCIGL